MRFLSARIRERFSIWALASVCRTADGDHRLEGGSIVSRLFLQPYDEGAGTGSFLAIGLNADVPELHLGAALGVLQIGVSGQTTTPLNIVGLGKLKDDPASSDGRIYLSELAANVPGAVGVGFGTFAGADLTGAFAEVAAGDPDSAFELSLDFDDD